MAKQMIEPADGTYNCYDWAIFGKAAKGGNNWCYPHREQTILEGISYFDDTLPVSISEFDRTKQYVAILYDRYRDEPHHAIRYDPDIGWTEKDGGGTLNKLDRPEDSRYFEGEYLLLERTVVQHANALTI